METELWAVIVEEDLNSRKMRFATHVTSKLGHFRTILAANFEQPQNFSQKNTGNNDKCSNGKFHHVEI